MQLSTTTATKWDEEPFVVRVTVDASRPLSLRSQEAMLLEQSAVSAAPGFRLYLSSVCIAPSSQSESRIVHLPPELSYLRDGDLLAVRPRSGGLRVIYRKDSRHNSLMVTAACNNLCVMCAQPPQKADDRVFNLLWDAVPLMNINTPELILSGGEPTLLGRRLVELIRRIKCYLPSTALHILTNGRRLKFLTFTQDIAAIQHSDLMLGIPLYSDISHEHDFVVQAKGAFNETVQGILNAARCGIRVELRVVITKINFAWLPRLARFIARNFPFVSNVAFMGLEPVGLARRQLQEVWIDPADYAASLEKAVQELRWHSVPVSIYNHQLCTLTPGLWDTARQSISDWKNIFLPQCSGCELRHSCCGFFASNADVHSRAIKALASSDLASSH